MSLIQFLQSSITHGQIANIRLVLETILKQEESNPEQEKSGLTALHLAALTARTEKELPGPLNEDTVNAGAFPPAAKTRAMGYSRTSENSM